MAKTTSFQIKHFAVDSNVFRSKQFLNFLFTNKEKIKIYLLPIVQLEVGYYYMSKGKDWDDFYNYLSHFDAILTDWKNLEIPRILNSALSFKKDLPFKHHFRDFLIGVHCEKMNLDFITYNKKHFQWVKKVKIFTPDEIILNLTD